MDIGSKLIRKVCFTPASPHDSTVLEDLVSEDERSLFGDKAYSRESLKQIARENGWYYGILDKAKRNAPLSHAQKKRNRLRFIFACIGWNLNRAGFLLEKSESVGSVAL